MAIHGVPRDKFISVKSLYLSSFPLTPSLSLYIRGASCGARAYIFLLSKDEQLERVTELATSLETALEAYKAFLDELPPYDG